MRVRQIPRWSHLKGLPIVAKCAPGSFIPIRTIPPPPRSHPHCRPSPKSVSLVDNARSNPLTSSHQNQTTTCAVWLDSSAERGHPDLAGNELFRAGRHFQHVTSTPEFSYSGRKNLLSFRSIPISQSIFASLFHSLSFRHHFCPSSNPFLVIHRAPFFSAVEPLLQALYSQRIIYLISSSLGRTIKTSVIHLRF